MTAATLASKLAEAINHNSNGSGVTASVSDAKITITANKDVSYTHLKKLKMLMLGLKNLTRLKILKMRLILIPVSYTHLWDVLELDDIPSQGIAHQLFDTCVNCGKTTAIRIAQQVLMMTITGKWSDELKYNLMKYGNNK